MWMPEYGLGHNIVMGFGYLIGAGLLGSILYFTVTLWREADSARTSDSDEARGAPHRLRKR